MTRSILRTPTGSPLEDTTTMDDLDAQISAALSGFTGPNITLADADLDKAVAAALAFEPMPLPPQLSPPGTAPRAGGRAESRVHSGRPSGPMTATTCPLQPPAPVRLNFQSAAGAEHPPHSPPPFLHRSLYPPVCVQLDIDDWEEPPRIVVQLWGGMWSFCDKLHTARRLLHLPNPREVVTRAFIL